MKNLEGNIRIYSMLRESLKLLLYLIITYLEVCFEAVHILTFT